MSDPSHAFENKRAGEIMVPLGTYPIVRPEITLREAIQVMESSRFAIRCADGRMSLPRMLLVIDEDMRLAGTLRRRDILRALTPKFMRSTPQDSRKRIFAVEADPNLSEMSWDRLESMMKKRAERRVSEVMVPVRGAVDHEDHVSRVIDAMTEFDLSLVPVMEDGEVIGVVRSVDVLHEVARFILDLDEEPGQTLED